MYLKIINIGQCLPMGWLHEFCKYSSCRMPRNFYRGSVCTLKCISSEAVWTEFNLYHLENVGFKNILLLCKWSISQFNHLRRELWAKKKNLSSQNKWWKSTKIMKTTSYISPVLYFWKLLLLTHMPTLDVNCVKIKSAKWLGLLSCRMFSLSIKRHLISCMASWNQISSVGCIE